MSAAAYTGWAIVEVMGHSKFAGEISEHKLGTNVMIRIDVPAVGELKAFTKMIAPQALFAITPCDEATARAAAQEFRSVPLYLYSVVRGLPTPDDDSKGPDYFEEDYDEDDEHPHL